MSEIDLKPFCDTEDGRYKLSQEFVRDGWRCASDGRIFARVPSADPDTPADVGRFPDAKSLFDKFPSNGFLPINSIIGEGEPDPDGVTICCDCAKLAPCDECHGTGETECRSCGQACDCEDCDGTGAALKPNRHCKKCDGNGEVVLIRHKVSGIWFRGDYLVKVQALPSAEAAVVDAGDSKSMLAFRFDGGGQGLLMCMTYPTPAACRGE